MPDGHKRIPGDNRGARVLWPVAKRASPKTGSRAVAGPGASEMAEPSSIHPYSTSRVVGLSAQDDD